MATSPCGLILQQRRETRGCAGLMPSAGWAEWSSPGAMGSWAAAASKTADLRVALPWCAWWSALMWRLSWSASPSTEGYQASLAQRNQGMCFTCSSEPPAASTQGDRGGCHCRPPRAVPFAGSGYAGVSAPASLSGSQSIFLTHQHRCSRGCWSKDGQAFTKRCQAVTEHLLFKRGFTVLDFMTFTA